MDDYRFVTVDGDRGPAVLTRDEYAEWWRDNTDDDGELRPLDDPEATLAAHIQELQMRIDKLMSPDEHDLSHGKDCRCMAGQCACAYDHPDAVCMTHEALASRSEIPPC